MSTDAKSNIFLHLLNVIKYQNPRTTVHTVRYSETCIDTAGDQRGNYYFLNKKITYIYFSQGKIKRINIFN